MRNVTAAAQNSQAEMLVHDSSAAEAFDVIVLGAGISGLVSASVLQKQGYRRIVVVDEYAHIGGNHIDCRIGDYTFDIGSLIFQNDSPLLAHLPELLPLYIEINPSWGRLNPQGVVTDYPISQLHRGVLVRLSCGSARGEDKPGSSQAGRYNSVLGVIGCAVVAQPIERVCNSFANDGGDDDQIFATAHA